MFSQSPLSESVMADVDFDSNLMREKIPRNSLGKYLYSDGIDKFLEDNSSYNEESPEKINITNDKEEKKKTKTSLADLVNNKITLPEEQDLEFIGKNPAIFQLLEDNENYGVYDVSPSENNWNVFYKTLSPDNQSFKIKSEIKEEPQTEIINEISDEDVVTELEDVLLFKNYQDDKIIKSPSNEIISNDHSSDLRNPIENFDNVNFSFKIDNFQENVISKDKFDKKLSTSATTENVNSKDIETFSFALNDVLTSQYYNFDIKNNSWKKSYEPYNISNTGNLTLAQNHWNNQNTHGTTEPEQLNAKNLYETSHTKRVFKNEPTVSLSEDKANSIFPSLNKKKSCDLPPKTPVFFNFKPISNNNQEQNVFKAPFIKNKNVLKNEHVQKHNSKPIQLNNQAFPNCIEKSSNDFKPPFISTQTMNKNSFNSSKSLKLPDVDLRVQNKQLHSDFAWDSHTKNRNSNLNSHSENYIKEYMYPASLDENTIQFSSKKFTNNNVRDEIIATLNKYGPHENSWWTPDDMFYVKYISKSIAKYVYNKYK